MRETYAAAFVDWFLVTPVVSLFGCMALLRRCGERAATAGDVEKKPLFED